MQALYANEAEFLRTPKTSEEAHFWDAIRANRAETFFGLLGLAGIVASLTDPTSYAGPLTAALLLWPTIAYLSAPLNSLAAQRAALPPELRDRRSTEFLRIGSARQVTAAAGGLALAGVAAAAVLMLTAPGNVHVNGPKIIGPVRGDSTSSSSSNPSEGPTTSPSTTSSTSESPTNTATSSPTAPSSPSGSGSPSSTPSESPTATSTSPSSSPSGSPTGNNATASASPTGNNATASASPTGNNATASASPTG